MQQIEETNDHLLWTQVNVERRGMHVGKGASVLKQTSCRGVRCSGGKRQIKRLLCEPHVVDS